MTPVWDDPSSFPFTADFPSHAHFLVRPQLLTRVLPLPSNGCLSPLCRRLDFAAGIFLLENLDLEGLTGERAAEFAFIVLPLKIKGDTGLTAAPLPGNDGERRSSQEGSPDPSCLARAVGRSRRDRAGHSAVRSRGETNEWREPW